MGIEDLHQWLIRPTHQRRSSVIFWFSLSLTFAAIYGLLVLKKAFSADYVVQDDARQHIFWMRRFIDPELFPHDLIADYFQSVAPWGYTHFYRLFAWLGIDPILFSNCLPFVLGLVATSYCFGVCLELLPIPVTGFIGSLCLNQNLWMKDDLVSATPVAFVYPLFLAFLYYLLRRSLVPCLIAIALLGLFYPQCVFLAAGILILQLWYWQDGRLRFSHQKQNYWFCAFGLGMSVCILLPYALESSEFGSVITADQARLLPVFSQEGWSSFFTNNPWTYWLCGKRSGMIPTEWCQLITKYSSLLAPPQIWLTLLLPFLLRFPSKFSLVQQVKPNIILLPQLLIVSVFMFFMAHLFLFKLHLPNRYTEHSFRMLAALAGGIALTIILDAMWQFWQQRSQPILSLSCAVLLGVGLILYPQLLIANNYPFPLTGYRVGSVPELYQFFQSQPKDSVIASLVEETNNLPSFAQRSILVGGEGYALPYHQNYYKQIYQRTIELIQAQYSPNLAEIQRFIKKYNINFWLLERDSFKPNYRVKDNWLKQYKSGIIVNSPKQIPVLIKKMKQCVVLKVKQLVVVNTECLLNL